MVTISLQALSWTGPLPGVLLTPSEPRGFFFRFQPLASSSWGKISGLPSVLFCSGESGPGSESPISFCDARVAHVPPGVNILGATAWSSEISWALARSCSWMCTSFPFLAEERLCLCHCSVLESRRNQSQTCWSDLTMFQRQTDFWIKLCKTMICALAFYILLSQGWHGHEDSRLLC